MKKSIKLSLLVATLLSGQAFATYYVSGTTVDTNISNISTSSSTTTGTTSSTNITTFSGELTTVSSNNNISIKNGWALRGTETAITNVPAVFGDASKVSIVWAYDDDMGWKAYSPNSAMSGLIPSTMQLFTIPANAGFWVKGLMTAMLDKNATSIPTNYTPFTIADISNKEFTIAGSPTWYSYTMRFYENGTYERTGLSGIAETGMWNLNTDGSIAVMLANIGGFTLKKLSDGTTLALNNNDGTTTMLQVIGVQPLSTTTNHIPTVVNQDVKVFTPIFNHYFEGNVSKQFSDLDGNETLRYTSVNLPEGMYLDTMSGMINGHISNAGSWEFTVTATDTQGASVNKTFRIEPNNVYINLMSTINYYANTSIPLQIANLPIGATVKWSIDNTNYTNMTQMAFTKGTHTIAAEITESSGKIYTRNMEINVTLDMPNGNTSGTNVEPLIVYGTTVPPMPSTLTGMTMLVPSKDSLGFEIITLGNSGQGMWEHYEFNTTTLSASSKDNGTFAWTQNGGNIFVSDEEGNMTLTMGNLKYVESIQGVNTNGLVEVNATMVRTSTSEAFKASDWTPSSSQGPITDINTFLAAKISENLSNNNQGIPTMLEGNATSTSGRIVRAQPVGEFKDCTSEQCNYYVRTQEQVGTWSLTDGILRETIGNETGAYRFVDGKLQQAWSEKVGTTGSELWYTGLDSTTMITNYENVMKTMVNSSATTFSNPFVDNLTDFNLSSVAGRTLYRADGTSLTFNTSGVAQSSNSLVKYWYNDANKTLVEEGLESHHGYSFMPYRFQYKILASGQSGLIIGRVEGYSMNYNRGTAEPLMFTNMTTGMNMQTVVGNSGLELYTSRSDAYKHFKYEANGSVSVGDYYSGALMPMSDTTFTYNNGKIVMNTQWTGSTTVITSERQAYTPIGRYMAVKGSDGETNLQVSLYYSDANGTYHDINLSQVTSMTALMAMTEGKDLLGYNFFLSPDHSVKTRIWNNGLEENLTVGSWAISQDDKSLTATFGDGSSKSFTLTSGGMQQTTKSTAWCVVSDSSIVKSTTYPARRLR